MAQTIIATFRLNEGQERAWQELSAEIQDGISRAKGFVSRDTGVDVDGNHYCIVKFNSKEEREESMQASMKDHPEMFERFARVVDMSTMKKTEIALN